jgi:hypothetical protein
MADTVKKATTPRKPRATAKAKVETAAPAETKKAVKAKVTPIKKAKAAPTLVSQEEIATLAHRFWQERGGQHGHHEEDWLRAEQALLGKAS